MNSLKNIPLEIQDHIWSFVTSKTENFNKCISELKDVFNNYRHAYQTAIKLDLTWRQRNLLPFSFMTSKPSEFLYSYAFKEYKYYLKKIRENKLFNKAISS